MKIFQNLSGKYIIPAFACIFLLSLSACHVNKDVAEKTNEKPIANIIQKPEFYLNHRLEYKTFNGKGSVHIVTEDKNQNLDIVISMNKDKDILGSIRAMGLLEVARAYATPDSLFALNRMNKTAYELGFVQGTKLLQTEIPFDALQSLFTGSPLMPATTTAKDMTVKDSVISIRQEKDSFVQVLNYDAQTQVLKSLSLTNLNKAFKCNIDFKNYRKIGIGQPFSYDRNIQIEHQGKKINIELSFNQAMIDVPVNTNFRVPGSYKVVRQISSDDQK